MVDVTAQTLVFPSPMTSMTSMTSVYVNRKKRGDIEGIGAYRKFPAYMEKPVTVVMVVTKKLSPNYPENSFAASR